MKETFDFLPPNVRIHQTTRMGGVSTGVWGNCFGQEGLNPATHVGDDPSAVAENRHRIAKNLPEMPVWLTQVHGTTVYDLDQPSNVLDADAVITRQPGRVCAVMTADCLPVLLWSNDGLAVGAAHAGWRGLCAGVLETTVLALRAKYQGADYSAWLGPAIGPDHFEVGAEVKRAFLDAALPHEKEITDSAFQSIKPTYYLANIYLLARLRLNRMGISAIYGGHLCTVCDVEHFYSYRRDGVTGRMASLIWKDFD